MKPLQCTQLIKGNEAHRAVFETLFLAYDAELREHNPDYLPKEFLMKWFNSIIDMQGDADRHLELCYAEDAPIGFLYGKVDHAHHRGFVKPGWGYIMEFYVKPEYRRNGYGKTMARRLERLFAADGATQMYTQVDEITGRPFWTAMGFTETDERSPENGKPIWVKAL
ncbi:MAG: GNAT family N-acetyltransferase [Oscillospiraceae bacterium]|jgi:ribosomal protein S18 acetylase RimI-like enzyme|nr:GNAT family N-acetyltransferase [Oscillospiraceae bacterium]